MGNKWREFQRQDRLASNFIFYERLNNKNQSQTNKNLYRRISDEFSSLSNNLNDLSKNLNWLFDLADKEKRKEIELLKKYGWGINEFDWKDPETVKAFIRTLNETLQLKEVFERNRQLLLSGANKKPVVNYFPTYFQKIFNEKIDLIIAEMEALVEKRKISWDEAFEKVLNESKQCGLDVLIYEAVEAMFTSEVEVKSNEDEGIEGIDPSLKDAYLPLLSSIGDISQKGSFSSSLYDIYGLKDFARTMIDSLEGRGKKKYLSMKEKKSSRKNSSTKASTIIKRHVGENLFERGGNATEALLSLMGKHLNGVNSQNNIKITATRTGQSGVKADVVTVITKDVEATVDVEKILDEYSRGAIKNKGDALKGTEVLREKLSKLTDVLIIYQNAKAYLPSSVKKGGFKAGSPINMNSLFTVLDKVEKNADTIIGAILNTAKGAIGADENIREKLMETLAADIAIMLFDDYETIGNKIEGESGAIHILYLNGIMVPLSLFLRIVAEALEDTASSLKSLSKFVKVNISAPEILWPMESKDGEERYEYNNKIYPPHEAWELQRTEGKKRTKVSYTFLRNFEEKITPYLINKI